MSVESPVYVAIRFALLVAITLLLGGLSVAGVIRMRYVRAGAADAAWWDDVVSRVRKWMTWSLAVFAVATLARLGAQHASYFGSRAWSGETLQPILMQTDWGRGWRLALAAVMVGFAGLFLNRRTVQRPAVRAAGWGMCTAAILALVLSLSMSGHPAAADQPRLAMAVDALHVLGAGGWIGTLAILMLVAVPDALRTTPAPPDRVSRLIAVFSPTALLYAAVLLITGVIASWRMLDSIEALFTSTYGQLLLWKVGAVGVVALIGAYNWKRVLPFLGTGRGVERLKRSGRMELAVAVVVLGITAVLVATSP